MSLTHFGPLSLLNQSKVCLISMESHSSYTHLTLTHFTSQRLRALERGPIDGVHGCYGVGCVNIKMKRVLKMNWYR